MKNSQRPTKKLNYVIGTLAMCLLCTAQAFAQSNRIFIATTGTDSATCGATTSPCRSFQQGLFLSPAGGEVIALDSGIYDTVEVAVTKSITLTAAPGVHAELYNNYVNPNRISVSAGANGRVTLRNLYLSNRFNEAGGDGVGINVVSVGVLQIENSIVDGFATGLAVNMSNAAQISIKDTIFRNNSGNGAAFFTSTGPLKVSIDSCHFDNNGVSGSEFGGNGALVDKHTRVTIRDSVATGNAGAGFIVQGDNGEMNLEHCESSNNKDGVRAWDLSGVGGGGTATVSNSTITNNSRNGFYQQGAGVFQSMQNNLVRRNGTNAVGTIGSISGT